MLDNLTPRETQVAEALAEGLTNKEIAERLDVSAHTVKFHVANTCRKLNASTRTRAAVAFVTARAAQPVQAA